MKTSLSFKENIVKNILIVVIALLSYPFVVESIRTIKMPDLNNFLLLVSIFLVTVCFANFAFTYEKANIHTTFGRWLAHSATFVFMLLMALLLESLFLGVVIVYPSLFGLVLTFSVLLYIGVVLFDFWDYKRAADSQNS